MGRSARTIRLSPLTAAISALCLFLAPTARGQRIGEATGFKLADYFPAPHEAQIKSLIEGAKGRLLENGNVFITDLTLHTYVESGQPELVVKAPECLYDQKAAMASSPGQLRVETADGKFTIEGEGFQWSQTNSSLFISNGVHTVVQPDLLQTAAAGGGDASASGRGPMELFADQFEYRADAGLAIYRGSVSVTGTNYLALSGGELQLKLPAAQRRLETVTMEQQVEVFYEGIHGSGQKAVYAVDTGVVRVTGQPAWRVDQREGGGRELILDRTNRVVRAVGEAWMKLPGQTLAAMNFLPGESAPTNSASPAAQLLQVFCDNYEFHTNRAVFHERVNVVQVESARPKATMNCGVMTALFGRSNDLQTLTAERDVVMERQADSGEKVVLSGRKAVYETASGLMTLAGDPRWRAGAKEGRGTLIQMMAPSKEMIVRGDASMRLPAEEMRLAAGAASPTKAPGLAPEFADIRCAQYRLRPEQGLFEGGVQVAHPQSDLQCDEVTVDFPPRGGQISRVVADRSVVFNLHDEKGQTTHGTGNKAVYTYSVESSVTNDLVRLTGSPAVIQSTNNEGRSRFVNDLILLDRAHGNKIMTPGKYELRMAQRGTNTVKLPKLR